MSLTQPFITAMIIPTGIGARIGGYGGDATSEMNLLASVSDILITHPNVANAAAFQKLPLNALYVEGYALDQFFCNRLGLLPIRQNRVGVVFDRGIEERMLNLHLNTIEAVKSVYGVDVIDYALTEEPVDVRCTVELSGSSSGALNNSVTILNACEKLIHKGAQALALCVQMPELEGESHYQAGEGVDPVGGIEAILSHLVVSELGIPCAHAPVFKEEDALPEMEKLLDPKTAPEYIVSTFLPCVLTGLSRAPQFTSNKNQRAAIWIEQLDAIVLPEGTLGGIPALSALKRNIATITVAQNQSVLSINAEALGIEPDRILCAQSYYEAAGMIAALKQGQSIPLPKTRRLDSPRLSESLSL